MTRKADELETLFNEEKTHVVLVEMDGLHVPCRVISTKRAYGHTRYEIEPVGGRGRKTVNSDRVTEKKR